MYSIESAPGHVMPNLCFCIGGGGSRSAFRGAQAASHVVHSGVPRPQNIDALFVMLGCDRYGFYKKRAGPR
jgi:hypothetical protein